MSQINQEIGKKIRIFRKMRNLTLDELALKIYKSKSTISKYEKGEIAIDIETLYDIADALMINVEQLLYVENNIPLSSQSLQIPSFFDGISQFYSYLYDGRSQQLIRCVFDVLFEAKTNQFKVMMYMNFKDFNSYQNCENTY